MDLEGKKPALSTPIYSGEVHGSFTLAPGAALSLPNTSSSIVVLGEALSENCKLMFGSKYSAVCLVVPGNNEGWGCWMHPYCPCLLQTKSSQREQRCDPSTGLHCRSI